MNITAIVVSKFGIKSHAVNSMWVRPPHVAMLITCPNITLAVEQGLKTSTLTLSKEYFWFSNSQTVPRPS